MEQKNIIEQLGIRVLLDNVLLEVDKNEVTTDGGLILSNNDSIKKGKVVAVGKGKRNNNGEFIAIDLDLNDEVFYQYGTEIKIEGKPYIVVAESDILTVKKK